MIKRLLLLSLTVLALSLGGLVAAPAMAQAADVFGPDVCNTDNDKAKESAACKGRLADNENPLIGQNGIIKKATDVVAFAGGAAAIILIIVSGIQYVTSGGDSNKINTAKGTVFNALIGLVLIVLARSLIIFVINRFND